MSDVNGEILVKQIIKNGEAKYKYKRELNFRREDNMNLKRITLSFRPNQYLALEKLSEKQNCSIAALVRDILAKELETELMRYQYEEQRKQVQAELRDEIRQLRNLIEAREGKSNG